MRESSEKKFTQPRHGAWTRMRAHDYSDCILTVNTLLDFKLVA